MKQFTKNFTPDHALIGVGMSLTVIAYGAGHDVTIFMAGLLFCLVSATLAIRN